MNVYNNSSYLIVMAWHLYTGTNRIIIMMMSDLHRLLRILGGMTLPSKLGNYSEVWYFAGHVAHNDGLRYTVYVMCKAWIYHCCRGHLLKSSAHQSTLRLQVKRFYKITVPPKRLTYFISTTTQVQNELV